jgi:hypothetical protein
MSGLAVVDLEAGNLRAAFEVIGTCGEPVGVWFPLRADPAAGRSR